MQIRIGSCKPIVPLGFDITINSKLTNWSTAIQRKKGEFASLRTGNTLFACLAAMIRTIRANSIATIRYDLKTAGFHPIACLRFVTAVRLLSPAIVPSSYTGSTPPEIVSSSTDFGFEPVLLHEKRERPLSIRSLTLNFSPLT
jgi:hypothetical protein